MDVNSKEAELWSETMRLKSSVDAKDAEIERLKAALDPTLYADAKALIERQRARIERLETALQNLIILYGGAGGRFMDEARAALAGKEPPPYDLPMLCHWCGDVHVGGPENCGKPDKKPALARKEGT